jgi:hypothetical protein
VPHTRRDAVVYCRDSKIVMSWLTSTKFCHLLEDSLSWPRSTEFATFLRKIYNGHGKVVNLYRRDLLKKILRLVRFCTVSDRRVKTESSDIQLYRAVSIKPLSINTLNAVFCSQYV